MAFRHFGNIAGGSVLTSLVYSALATDVYKRQLVKCPQCGELQVPHKVCGKCGYYKGQEVIKKEAEVACGGRAMPSPFLVE